MMLNFKKVSNKDVLIYLCVFIEFFNGKGRVLNIRKYLNKKCKYWKKLVKNSIIKKVEEIKNIYIRNFLNCNLIID